MKRKNQRCENCIAMQIKKTLEWKGTSGELSALSYDESKKTIVIDEFKLMRAIMLANPCQKPRKIVIRGTLKENQSVRKSRS